MHFAPDTEDALHFAVALVNTAAEARRTGSDELAEPPDLTTLLQRHGYSGRVDGDESELAEVRETRSRLRLLWTMDRDLAVGEINGILREAKALPFLTRHDEFDWHLHATAPDAPLAERIRVEVALGLADVVRTNEMGRLRSCGAEDCGGILLDLSRNGSKRFCSVRCSNRVNMVAFRERAATRSRPDQIRPRKTRLCR